MEQKLNDLSTLRVESNLKKNPMINISLKFFKKIYNEDVIYHYTKASTAIDYILFNEQLKFSKRQKSIDPTESRKVNRSTVFTGSFMEKKVDKKISHESNELINRVSGLESLFSQICFCKNDLGHEFDSENYITQFEGHEEIFGFTKPRMWERYSDNYRGVCLAFSKKKILALNSKKYQLICKDVEYLKYRELECRKVNYTYGNHLFTVGFDNYSRQIEEIAESSFFCKHIDYIGENEFRIGVYHEDDKCIAEEIRGEFQFNQTMLLDIRECIEAIFISSFANKQQKKTLLEYADNMNVPIIEMVWKHDSFEPKDYRESEKLYKT